MPLYLVRWGSTLTVSFVQARSEEDLMDIIDEIASPSACTWSKYAGPLWIDLTVPITADWPTDRARPLRAADVKVGRPKELEAPPLAIAEPDDCDTVREMKEAVLRQAFPVLARAVYGMGAET